MAYYFYIFCASPVRCVMYGSGSIAFLASVKCDIGQTAQCNVYLVLL